MREQILPTTRLGAAGVVAILVVALAIRLIAVFVLKDGYQPLTDAIDYDRIASSLARGEGYPGPVLPFIAGDESAFRPPAYPLLLASVYAVLGAGRWTVALLLNAALGVVVVALIGIVAAQVFGRRVGFVALAIGAFHPALILFGTSIQIEPLLVTFELAAIGAALAGRRSERMAWPIVAGASVGAAALTREIGFLVLPTVLLLLWKGRPRWRRPALRAPLVALAASVAIVAPWTVRNAIVMDDLVVVSSSSGIGVAGTYNDSARTDSEYPARWRPPWLDDELGQLIEAGEPWDEVELDREMRDEAVSYALDHPLYVFEAVIWNTARLFGLTGPEDAVEFSRFIPYPPDLVRASVIASYGVWILGVAALGFRRLRRMVPWPLLLFPALAWLSLALVAGNLRYRASLEPLAVVFAAAALTLLSDRWRSSQPVIGTPRSDCARPESSVEAGTDARLP